MQYKYGTSVTPHDTNDLSVEPCEALYIGNAGDVKVRLEGMADDDDVLFKAVPTGTLLKVRATRVFDTDTTSTSIVALY